MLAQWLRFGTVRSAQTVAALLLLVVITFLMVELVPGDPAQRVAGLGADPEYVDRLRDEMGLDAPYHVRFRNYVGGLLRFDLGRSFLTNRPVVDVIGARLPYTLRLAVPSMALVMLAGVGGGILFGGLTHKGRHPRLDGIITTAANIGAATPDYVVAAMLVWVFAVSLSLLPVASPNSLLGLVLPVAAICIRSISLLVRIVRAETATVLDQLYIRTARGKRLPSWLIYARHVLPNSLTASLTVGGLIMANLVGGTVIIENVFAWPGLGTAVVSAVTARDYPLIQGIVLLLGGVVLVLNMIIDLILGIVDPRSTIT